MKISSLLLGGSLVANLALIVLLLVRPADGTSAGESSVPGGAAAAATPDPAAAGAVTGTAGGAGQKTAARPAGGARKAWDQLHTEDLAALVPKLREAGFPPTVIRRVVATLVSERYDSRRLELEKAILEAPFWQNAANSYNDPKIGPQLIKLQREQTEEMKKILGGSLNDLFADTEENKAMLRLQIGDIPPEKIDQLYAAAMDFGVKRQEINAARGNSGPMLAADYEKTAAIERAYREELAKFLTPAEASDFMMRNSEAAGRLRNLVGPARPTEDEYRAIFPIYQAYLDQFPAQSQQGETPERAGARKAAEEQMLNQLKGVVGAERAVDFQQAGNPAYGQLNRLVARLDLPISAATQVVAVQADMQKRVGAVRSDESLNAAARNQQLALLAQEASGKLSEILGGSRGLEAYKQYSGQWLVNMAPRPPPQQPPKN